jgi:exoribonuclease R
MDGKNIRLFERFEEAVAFTSADPIRRFTDLATIRTIEEILDAMPETPENR